MLIGTTANKKFTDGLIPPNSRRARTGITESTSEPYMAISFFGTLGLPRGASQN